MAPTARLTVQQRQEIGESAVAGQPIKRLARRYNVTPETVRRWAEEAQKPTPNYRDAPGCGRPRVLSSAERKQVRRAAKRGATVPNLLPKVNTKRTQKVSQSTVRRVLTKGAKALAWLPRTRGRVLSPANMRKRYAFCVKHADS